jgi:hypothetical protein
MSFSTDINIKDNATPALEAQVSRLEPRFVNRIAGRAGQNVVRSHLFKYNAEHPNQLGGKRTNFYAQAARGTTFVSDDSKAVVSINQVGIRQRWLGGEIKPTGTNPRTGQPIKYLAIPARAEAYGRRAGELDNLSIQWGKNGPVALVENLATKVRSTKKGFKSAGETGGAVYYWLVPSVVQQGDPGVIPTREQLIAGIVQELGKAISIKEKLTRGAANDGGAA